MREKTNLERFGVSNPFKSEEKKEKIRQTNLKKYGKTHRLKNKDEVNKQKKNNLLKYGTETPFQLDEVKEIIVKQKNIKIMLNKQVLEDIKQNILLNLKKLKKK